MIRSTHHLFALATIALMASCTSSGGDAETTPAEEEILPGFHPPPAAPGDVRIVAPMIRGIEPGRDVTYCTYIENPFGREVDVIQSLGFQSKFGHHALLMEVPGATAKPGDSHVCTEADMTTARFLAGGSDAAQNIVIPEGIAFRISPKANLMIQTHWINTTDKPADGATVFNVAARDPDPTRQAAQLFTVLTTSFELAPRSTTKASTDCTIQEDLSLFNFGGHEHEWGTHVHVDRIRNGVSEVLYDQPWLPEYQSNPPLKLFEVRAPLSFKKGDVLHVDCEWKNTEDHAIVFPREMCVAFGFHFPATADIQCVDNKWIKP
jgi:hypothetical protein